MKNNQETLLHFMKQVMLAEHIHSVAWPLKVDEKIFLEFMDDDVKSKAIKGIENKLLADLKSEKYEALIQIIANLTWKSETLMHVSVAMAQKIERDRESTLKLIDREHIFEDVKISKRKKGATSANKIFDSEIKRYAKKKREEIRRLTGKPCGAKTLQKALDESHKGHNLSIHILNGWIKQWKNETKK